MGVDAIECLLGSPWIVGPRLPGKVLPAHEGCDWREMEGLEPEAGLSQGPLHADHGGWVKKQIPGLRSEPHKSEGTEPGHFHLTVFPRRILNYTRV